MESHGNFKKIIIIVLLSLIIGLIHIYPDLKFIYEPANNFKGITFHAAHDSAIYLGMIDAVYKGDSKTIPAIDIYEHRGDPWTLPFLGELVLGTIGSTLHIPSNYFKIIFSFILPVVDFWLIYLLAILFIDSTSVAIITALAVTLGYSFFANNPLYIYSLLFNRGAAIQLWFSRPISPQLDYIFLFISWILVYFFMTKRRYVFAILSGLSIGLFFYLGGPYYITYFFTFIALYIFLTIIKKDYHHSLKILVMLLLVVVMAMPFAINYLKLIHLPEYGDLLERLAFIYGRRPIIPAGIAVISIFLVWFHYSRNTRQASFIILFILSGFICLNQQLITGKTSQPSHWQNYMVKTFTLVALFPTLALFLKENKYLYLKRRLLRNVAIAILIFLSLMQQENYYQRFKNKFVEKQSLAAPFNWLKENTKREDVVLNDPMNYQTGNIPFQQDFLIYTNNYVYLPAQITTLVSPDEVEHRYLSALRFFDYDLNGAERFFTYWEGIFFRGMAAEVSYGGSKMPDNYLLHLKNKYVEFLKEDPVKLLSRYKIDYVILRRTNPLYGKIDTIYKPLLKVYDDGQFKIYKIHFGGNRDV